MTWLYRFDHALSKGHERRLTKRCSEYQMKIGIVRFAWEPVILDH